ncbi:unnamed protein product [Orchesella dallaii]|uniref:Uncharacterized protein n=1 Tax=Orchesella dallaii TaxID=48710 RepID=A0ABP1QKM8_9HEXA
MSKRWITITQIVTTVLVFTCLSQIPSVESSSATAKSISTSSSSHLTSNSSPSSSAAAAKEEGDDILPQGESPPSSIEPELPETVSEIGSVIPGIYKEYLPQPIYYESVVPAIFQYQTPQWNKTEITFNNWYTCVSETIPYRYSCPVTFHMNKAIVNLHVDFEGLHPISDTRTQVLQQSMTNYYDRLTSHSSFCDRIQKHFPGIWTETADLQRYLNALKGCSRGSDLHPYLNRSIIDYNYSIRQPFTRMENNFYNTFYKHILGSGGKNSSLDLVASALLSNTRTSLQAAVLGQYYAEKNRWIHANEDCRQGFIPTSLVTPDKFNDSLSQIHKMKIFQKHSEFSISTGEMSKYYSAPIADCTHTSDSFVVRVLIPIVKKYRREMLQLVHVHTIPFLYNDHVCKVKLPVEGKQDYYKSQDSIYGEMDSSFMYLYHEIAQRAYRTNCKPNQLCKIPDYMLDSRKSDPCVSALLSRSDSGIRKYCDFECLLKDQYFLPNVVRVATNKFVVTGDSLTIKIACRNEQGSQIETEKLVYLKPGQIGATLFKLPCNCRMVIPHVNEFYGGQPCDETTNTENVYHSHDEPRRYREEVTFSSIIPFMFGKVKSNNGGQQTYQRTDKNANAVYHEKMDYYDSLDGGDLLNLTEIIDTERIEKYISASEKRRERERNDFMGMDYYAEKLVSGSDEGGPGLGGFFWSVFIISFIVILSLQAYIIVMLKRNERISYSKADRILYRVEPDATSLG